MIDIATAHTSLNLAEDLTDDELWAIGREACEAADADDQSRQSWIDDHEEYLKLAAQVRESKGTPWQNASNVKYPLLTLAAVHFHARAMPGLINGERPVFAKVNGRANPEKEKRASRVSTFMSYQINSLTSEWMDVMDRLLFVLPIVGLAYKKTFYCELKGRDASELVLPSELIVNYFATDYDRASLTHIRYMDANELIEHQRMGYFLDIDLEEIDGGKGIDTGSRDDTQGFTPPTNAEYDEAYKLYERHGWWDLDGDGYKEPYIVTLDSKSKKVVRIVARWKEKDIQYNEEGQVARIKPTQYFTPYQLVPDPNSAVYALGFGSLLGSTNEAVNTILNQLIDAGTLSNLQSGFIGRGVKLPGGATRFKPGEWKLVNSTGDDIRKAVFPMPVREPSGTLLSLLQLLLDAGQQVTSVSDMMMGENPGQNQKATTTMAVLEQGLSVFKGIYRRIHRSLTRELRLIADLNFEYLEEELYKSVLDDSLPGKLPSANATSPDGMIEQSPDEGSAKEDFDLSDMDITPTSDPSIITDAQRLAKAQSLMEKMAMGLPVNPMVITKRVLEAEQQENIEELMTLPPPRPSLEEQQFELELAKERRELWNSFHDNIKKVAEAEAAEEGTQLNTYTTFVKDQLAVAGLERELANDKAAAAQAAAKATKPTP